MKFKIINEPSPNLSATEQVLINRGIEKENIQHYLNTTDRDINDYQELGMNWLNDAACLIVTCVNLNKSCRIVVDSDCDGYTSAALLINYLYDLFPSWVENKLTWFIHNGKEHGLSDFFERSYPDDLKLVICPDSSSNDYDYHKQLADLDIDVLVIDHHEAEKRSVNATVINNQLSPYPNKELSGVGVTWQFCNYFDELMKTHYADNYIDLVALGNMADMMSLKSLETKHLILKGFKDENLKNPFIYGMAKKNAYSLGDHITPMGAAFYIAPFVNAMVRSGTEEEKELLFRSMLKFKAFEEVPSTKRGHKLGETEIVWEQAIRVAANVKNRQTKAQEAGLEYLEKMIKENNLLNHKVLLFLLKPGEVESNIRGLIANKFMAKYQRPCCILTRVEEEIEPVIWLEENLDKGKEALWNKDHKTYTMISYQGSARGYDKSGITNFKDICEAAPGVMYAEGHQGAFGLGIELMQDGGNPEDYEMEFESVYQFLNYTDDVLKDMPDEPVYSVDYIYENKNVNPQHILEIGMLEDLWGKDMDEPYVAIKGLKLTKDMVEIYERRTNTIKIKLPNGVSVMKFLATDEECKLFNPDGFIELDIIAHCDINEWNGNRYPQLLIEDYEVVDSCKYFF